MDFRKIPEFNFDLNDAEVITFKERDPAPIDVDEPVKELINMYHSRKDIFSAIRQGSIEKTIRKEKYHVHVYAIDLCSFEETCRFFGVATSKQGAKKDAASRAIFFLKNKFDFIQMPCNLIGLPNMRGHSYFVPVVLPLFHSKCFAEAMESGLRIAERDKREFRLYYILRAFFKNYRRASFDPNFKTRNYPVGLPLPGNDTKPWLENQPGRKVDLQMDANIIKTCIALRQSKPEYAKPGGLPTKLYSDMLSQLQIEFGQFNPFHSTLWCGFRFEVLCELCNTYQTLCYDRPYIEIMKKYKKFPNLQSIFSDPQNIMQILNMSCSDSLKECNATGFIILDYEFHNPDILTIIIPGNSSNDIPDLSNIKLDDKIKIKGIEYERFAYSVGFYEFTDASGAKYPPRQRLQEENDIVTGVHEILMIKYKGQWKEVSNDEVYDPNYRYDNGRDQMLIFYKKTTV